MSDNEEEGRHRDRYAGERSRSPSRTSPSRRRKSRSRSPAQRLRDRETSPSRLKRSRNDDHPLPSTADLKSPAAARPVIPPVSSEPEPLSFKNWLLQQDDSVNEDNAAEKFLLYKASFSATLVQSYFNQAKNQQWFREKYHPDQCVQRSSELHNAAERRLQVFLDSNNKGLFNGVDLVVDNIRRVHQVMEIINESLDNDGTDQRPAPPPAPLPPSNSKSNDDAPPPLPPGPPPPTQPPPPPSQPPPPPASSKLITPIKANIPEDLSTLPPNAGDYCRVKQQHTLFLGFIPATVTRAQLLEVLRPVAGFRRLALSIPTEKNKERLGWAVFTSTSNMTELRAKLHRVRVGDSELHVTVHEAPSYRLVGINHAMTMEPDNQQDHELLVGLITAFDSEKGLYTDTQNPLLSDANTSHQLMIWYLRVVHMYDYYGATECLYEDDMPIRMGLVHVAQGRGSSSATVRNPEWYARVSQRFESKILSEQELQRLGLKNEEEEVQKFLNSVTVKLEGGQFQCSLNNKKFMAEEFVHKHVINKHNEKIADVKKEVVFFNNYLRDPRRKLLPRLYDQPSAVAGTATVTVKDAFGRDVQLRHQTGDADTVNAPPIVLAPVHQPQVIPAFHGRAAALRPVSHERQLTTYYDLDAPHGPDLPY